LAADYGATDSVAQRRQVYLPAIPERLGPIVTASQTAPYRFDARSFSGPRRAS